MVHAVHADSMQTLYGLCTDLWSPHRVCKDRWGTVKYSPLPCKEQGYVVLVYIIIYLM
jgi:hypothetical protein